MAKGKIRDLKAFTPEPREVASLLLDPFNPRVAGRGFTINDQEGILATLWAEWAVNEIVDSIAASGYWPHEVLFAAEEEGRWVVIEGNRRLAAVKLLRDHALCARVRATGVPSIGDSARASLEHLPTVACSRESIWEYVGFKHLNGPQDWDSIAKAQYVARIHHEYSVPLGRIAQTIGDRHETVTRMYRGLMVLEQAENEGVFDRASCWGARFAYSHLWTALGYEPVQKFLGIAGGRGFKKDPVPKAKVPNLGELCRWLYGDKAEGVRPLVRSQNPDLRNLASALRTEKGVAALRAGLPLQVSIDIARGDEELLREALVAAEGSLRKAKGFIATGFAGRGGDILSTARAVSTLASSILREMESICQERQGSRKE